jgi:hypothetical protein
MEAWYVSKLGTGQAGKNEPQMLTEGAMGRA